MKPRKRFLIFARVGGKWENAYDGQLFTREDATISLLRHLYMTPPTSGLQWQAREITK